MQCKLETLLEILMKNNYTPYTISQAIMIPITSKNPEKFIDDLIQIAKETTNKKEFFSQMEKLTTYI